jgi:DNA polymerase-3 subunit beta
MTITIQTNQLKALLLCAAKKDIRNYLNGIFFETNTAGLTAVSTDGHRLLAIQLEFNDNLAPLSVIVPRAAIEQAVKTKAVSLIIDFDTDDKTFSISDGSFTINGLLEDGVFPNWRSVIPRTINNEAVSFNNDYLADFDKVSRLLCGGNCKVLHNGNNSALVRFNSDNILGVVMPLRGAFTPESSPPAWVQSDVLKPTPRLEIAA